MGGQADARTHGAVRTRNAAELFVAPQIRPATVNSGIVYRLEFVKLHVAVQSSTGASDRWKYKSARGVFLPGTFLSSSFVQHAFLPQLQSIMN
jgi:hypothetical protein